MSDPVKPKELYIDEKWDRLIDATLKRVVYGALMGGTIGLLASRGATARVAFLAFGAGVGAGSAWQECAQEFEGGSRASSS